MPIPRPLLLPAPPEPFPGWTNVKEVPGELGGTLLVLFRSVLLWAESPAAERATLFSGRSAGELSAPLDRSPLPQELADAVRELCAVRTAPGRVRPSVVSRACDAVSAWAEREEHPGTALAWARAAASAYPPNVAAAYRVGIMARRRADYSTAEAWLQHAGSMARRNGNWYGFVLALNSLGNLHVQHGEFDQARAHLAKALTAARRPRGRVEGGRKRLRVREGYVLHDLMMVSVYVQDLARAERYAAEAFERMRAGSRRLPFLAHDVAFLWMERGRFARALQVFEAVLPYFRGQEARARVLTNLLRAAGATGRVDAFDRHAGEARSLLEAMPAAETPAAFWTCLARGEASLGHWAAAERAAVRAGEVAELRQEADQRAAIEPLLESIRLHRHADAPAVPASPLEERACRSLTAGLVESLSAMRAGE
jgi:tetratricopeptide (TPR) repeat protein